VADNTVIHIAVVLWSVPTKSYRHLFNLFVSCDCECCAFVGVVPSFGNKWTHEVKEFFSNLVLDKTFIVYVQPQLDVTMASSASEEHCAVLLVEDLANRTFVYVHSVLISMCSGVKRSKV